VHRLEEGAVSRMQGWDANLSNSSSPIIMAGERRGKPLLINLLKALVKFTLLQIWYFGSGISRRFPNIPVQKKKKGALVRRILGRPPNYDRFRLGLESFVRACGLQFLFLPEVLLVLHERRFARQLQFAELLYLHLDFSNICNKEQLVISCMEKNVRILSPPCLPRTQKKGEKRERGFCTKSWTHYTFLNYIPKCLKTLSYIDTFYIPDNSHAS
jgi:hypothetical protein